MKAAATLENRLKSAVDAVCRVRYKPERSLGFSGENAMKRLLILSLVTLATGCVGFDDYAPEEFSQEQVAPTSCGCQVPTTPALSAVSGRLPTVNQLPTIQTREPDLLQPK
jgi:hypothetical protein